MMPMPRGFRLALLRGSNPTAKAVPDSFIFTGIISGETEAALAETLLFLDQHLQ